MSNGSTLHTSFMRIEDFVAQHARARPDAPFVKDDGRALTYAAFWNEARTFASILKARDVPSGARVACLSRNCVDMVVALFGCAMGGFIFTPLNIRLTAHEITTLLNDADPAVVLADDDLAETADKAMMSAGGEAHRFIFGKEEIGDWTSFTNVIAEESTQFDDSKPLDAGDQDAVFQLYTSGTTGVPKGVLQTHDNLVAQTLQQVMAYDYRYGEGDASILVTPMFHTSALVTFLAGAFLGELVVIHSAFETETFLATLEAERISHMMIVPAMIQACLDHPAAADTDFSALQQIVYGGSAISPSVLEHAIEVFGCRFTQGYGLTETTGVISALSWADHKRALEGRAEILESACRPVTGSALRVVGPSGDDMPPGEIGEILAKGPQVMTKGYAGKPKETAAVLSEDGWLRTGDAGCIDEDGLLFIKDRFKDVVVSGAENIYPREVEAVLHALPYVAEAAVIGVPSKKWGEEVKAVIALRDEAQVSDDVVITDCREKLAGFKCPKSVDFVAALPRNPSGKVLKHELRKPYWAGFERSVN